MSDQSSNPAPKACIIGHPVKHSRSPKLHGHWLETLKLPGSYGMQDVSPERIAAFLGNLRGEGFVGANVTVPHKLAALEAVKHADKAARATGAANTLWYEGDDLCGANTDVHGFVASLDESASGWDANPGLAVVLGAGGASRAIIYGLLQRGFDIAVVNRTVSAAEAVAAHFGKRVRSSGFETLPRLLLEAAFLVNTTALGMIGKPPLEITLDGLPRDAVVCDAVYVPLETDLLRQARARGNRGVDGLGMLLHQAVPGFARWFGVTPTVTPELRRLIEADIG